MRPRRSLSLILIAAVLASIAAASPALGVPDGRLDEAKAQWATEFPDLSFDHQLQYQRDFRDQFDFLLSDDQTISDALGRPASNDAMSRWGLKLSDAEYAELDRRVRIQKELPSIAAAAVGSDWSEELVEGLAPEKSFGAFAGRWIDQMDGGELVVSVAAGHPGYVLARQRTESVVDGLVAEGKLERSDVEIRDVTFSADDLYEVNREFGELFLAPGAENEPAMSAS
jgi:hypothetical protein